mmetsp:Transcript_46900/g.153559  ORF Transcript_46900/g.153559 Transcript_46900/m.153559 type:complete len:234 (+) Transcript_46900:64-765(+)
MVFQWVVLRKTQKDAHNMMCVAPDSQNRLSTLSAIRHRPLVVRRIQSPSMESGSFDSVRESSGPFGASTFTLIPSLTRRPSACSASYRSRGSFVKPQLLETQRRCRPGNLYFARRSDSSTCGFCTSRGRTQSRICPISTRATVPYVLPNAPRMPVCNRSAPAHESILLMRSTCHGCTRIRRWKASLPAFFTMYLLHATRAASSASEESCSFSTDTMCAANGKMSTGYFFLPAS